MIKRDFKQGNPFGSINFSKRQPIEVIHRWRFATCHNYELKESLTELESVSKLLCNASDHCRVNPLVPVSRFRAKRALTGSLSRGLLGVAYRINQSR